MTDCNANRYIPSTKIIDAHQEMVLQDLVGFMVMTPKNRYLYQVHNIYSSFSKAIGQIAMQINTRVLLKSCTITT